VVNTYPADTDASLDPSNRRALWLVKINNTNSLIEPLAASSSGAGPNLVAVYHLGMVAGPDGSGAIN